MSSRVRGGSKEMRALVRRLRPGLTVESDGKAKLRVVNQRTGEPVRMPDGKTVCIPNSPKTRGHGLASILKQLRDANVLREEG